jgi:transglutaminase-like putative cysteine protease
VSAIRAASNRIGALRVLAVLAAALVTGSYASVLYGVTTVVGVNEQFVAVVCGAIVAGLVCGRLLRTPVALVLGTGLLALGVFWYVQSVPDGVNLLVSIDQFRTDAVALLTGLSVLRVVSAGAWAIAFVPAPTFLLWYFTIRRQYVLGAFAGGAALTLLVLTGDAGTPLTLLGVVGIAGLVGFGESEGRAGGLPQAETVALALAVMVVCSLAVSVVPGGTASPVLPGGSQAGSIETSLVNADEQVSIAGSVSLSPAVRFTVRSEQPNYWRVGAYDRYTGGDWYRTGTDRQYNGTLVAPRGDSQSIVQTYEAETRLGVLPAAWRPTEIEGIDADRARVSSTGALRPANAISPGTSYTVRSQVPSASTADLAAAGREYPPAAAQRYTQLPDSTPDRVGRFTTRLTANAENPYETARVIERWLESNKAYSLDVERPDGDIAAGFLFEMDSGYCVYYATGMVAMLRTQDIPARFVTGYTPGEPTGDSERVVRGLDSHAWVEVYFPGQGWIRFDPTPSGPRENTEQGALEDARAAGRPAVDIEASAPTSTPETTDDTVNVTPNDTGGGSTPTPEETTPAVAGGDPGGDAGAVGTSRSTNTGPSGASGVGDGGLAASGDDTGPADDWPTIPVPSRERLVLGLVVLAGVVAGVHRIEIAGRAYRSIRLRRQRSRDPVSDTERALERLEYLLARDHRERRPGETPRAYLNAIEADERAQRVGDLYERARYGEHASEADGAEAIELVDELVAERSRFG